MVTVWIFGSQRRLVRRLEWLTLCPNWGPLPQISHFAINITSCWPQAWALVPPGYWCPLGTRACRTGLNAADMIP